MKNSLTAILFAAILTLSVLALPACGNAAAPESSVSSRATGSCATSEVDESKDEESGASSEVRGNENSVPDESNANHVLTLNEFTHDPKYTQLQSTVFEFFSTYIQSNTNAAKDMAVDGADFAGFPENAGTMDYIKSYAVTSITMDESSESACVTIAFACKDDAGATDISVYLTYTDVEGVIDGKTFTYKTWRITGFDLST